jgi:hypothetical protein
MSNWMGRGSERVSAVLVLGLVGCGVARDDTGDPSDTVDDGAPTAVIDAEGFETAPEVAFPAPAVTLFGRGDLLCSERRSEITPEAGSALGFDVAGDRTALEATHVLDVLASWNDVQPTAVHYRGRIARILSVDREPPAGVPVEEAVPAGCSSGVEYELIEQLYTEDGAVRGAFLAHVPATPLGESTSRTLSAVVDLRNFTGELPVGWVDSIEALFAAGGVAWTVGTVGSPEFGFGAMMWGGPGDVDCAWPFCRDDGDVGIPMSYGVAKAQVLESFDDLLSVFGPVFGPGGFVPRTLTQLRARMEAYRPNVRIWVTADAAEPSSVNRVTVTARADGQPLATRALDLAGNAERLPDGVVGGWIELGPISEGTTVDLEVRDDFGLGGIRSHIVVNDCDIGAGTSSCLEPGCTTETSMPIVAATCTGRVLGSR